MSAAKCAAAVLIAVALSGCALPHAGAITKLEVRSLPERDATAHILDHAADLLSRRSRLSEERRQEILMKLFKTVADDSSLVTRQTVSDAGDGDIRAALDRLAASSNFEPDPMASPNPRFSLHEYTLATGYRASPYAGLCVAGDFTVMFEPLGGERGPATPVRGSDILSGFFYHLLDPRATPRAVRATLATRAQADTACAALDRRNDAAEFSARDDVEAIEGTWLARAAIAGAGKNPLPFKLDCSGEDRAKCAAEIAQLPQVGIGIDSCETPAGGVRRCFIQAPGMAVTITASAGDPLRVLNVDASQTVVIADYRAD